MHTAIFGKTGHCKGTQLLSSWADLESESWQQCEWVGNFYSPSATDITHSAVESTFCTTQSGNRDSMPKQANSGSWDNTTQTKQRVG